MCLAAPARVLAVGGARATVETRAGRREVDVSLVRVAPGDFVLIQHGLAVAVLDPAEAEETLRAWDEVGGAPVA